ncbi:hypothetical protein LZ023_37290 (plasmid) [Pseudomonas silvicola]|nr:hypothetical protein LZ023_37290 [Pseudomonas silvicola]
MTDPNKHPEEEEKDATSWGHRNFAEDKERAAEAGRKGGQVESGGNLKTIRTTTARRWLGRKGGKISRRK